MAPSYSRWGAALCLALGNLLQRLRIRDSIQGSLPALIAWAALAPILPFFLAAWLFDGGQATLTALRGIDLTTLLALLYLAYIATHLAYAIWGTLAKTQPHRLLDALYPADPVNRVGRR
ncbi:Probable amino-acid metabolite efflux pump [Edwardsiella tarda]|nr:Probable amino-acid metabolite efflux pump [Edwardsiella tarda]